MTPRAGSPLDISRTPLPGGTVAFCDICKCSIQASGRIACSSTAAGAYAHTLGAQRRFFLYHDSETGSSTDRRGFVQVDQGHG